MPQTVAPIQAPPEPAPNRIRWTRHQCEAIRDAGILTGRYELINGEIISKMGQKPPHAHALNLLMRSLVRVFGIEFVRIQTTLDLSELGLDYDEPEPDATVTVEPSDAYADRHPGPTDVSLVVEVSDTTLRFDRTTKAGLYAGAGVVEYWVLDLASSALYVHRRPGPGGYGEIVRYDRDEAVAALARPDLPVSVASLLSG